MVISNHDSSRVSLATDLGTAVATMGLLQMRMLARVLQQHLKQAAQRQLFLRIQSQRHRQLLVLRRLANLLQMFKRALE